ncbi:hypothetical protein [Paenibacillus sp. FSL R7-269]|nr:hypothetical protein [Paenibacillus sp. FSL R7-269]
MLRPGGLLALSLTGLLSMRFYARISPYAGILATRGLGPSRDRTFTG